MCSVYNNQLDYFSTDVNECLTAHNGGCNQTCTNTLGSFECSCDTGYFMDTDRRTCNGKEKIVTVI